MPFLSKQDLEKLTLSPAMLQALTNADDTVFAEAEAAASGIIKLYADIEEPASAADAPEWVKLPAAWLVARILLGRLPDINPDLLREARANWNTAVEILQRHRPRRRSESAPSTGTISGMLTLSGETK